MIATVFTTEDDNGTVRLADHDGSEWLAVVDIDALSAHWRGDVFSAELVRAIQRATRTLATYGADS